MTPERTGQAEHLADTTREVKAVAALVQRAAEDYGDQLNLAVAGHADSWRLDLDLIAAERALRQIRQANAGWRQANELAVAEAEAGNAP